MSAYAYTMNSNQNPITPAQYAAANYVVTYVLNPDPRQLVRTMTVNLTHARLKGLDDSEGARRIVATTKGYAQSDVCLLDLAQG